MRSYRAKQTFTVGAGTILALTDEQVRRRRHQLEALPDGRWRTRQLVQFKAGESFGMEGELAKGLDAIVERIETQDEQPVTAAAATKKGRTRH